MTATTDIHEPRSFTADITGCANHGLTVTLQAGRVPTEAAQPQRVAILERHPDPPLEVRPWVEERALGSTTREIVWGLLGGGIAATVTDAVLLGVTANAFFTGKPVAKPAGRSKADRVAQYNTARETIHDLMVPAWVVTRVGVAAITAGLAMVRLDHDSAATVLPTRAGAQVVGRF